MLWNKKYTLRPFSRGVSLQISEGHFWYLENEYFFRSVRDFWSDTPLALAA